MLAVSLNASTSISRLANTNNYKLHSSSTKRRGAVVFSPPATTRRPRGRARSVVAPVAYTQWLLDKPGCASARCGDMDLIPHSQEAALGVCPPKPIDLTHLVLQCAEDGEECVIESAMFSIVDGNLFVSNVGAASGSPKILRGKGWVATEEQEEQGSGRGATAAKATLKPEDAAAGGEYVGGDDKEHVAEAEDHAAEADAAHAPVVIVDGESLPMCGKTRLEPGAVIIIGGGGDTHMYEVNRTVHAHA